MQSHMLDACIFKSDSNWFYENNGGAEADPWGTPWDKKLRREQRTSYNKESFIIVKLDLNL